jgi:quercetin dioxygenase-like cupin family protein
MGAIALASVLAAYAAYAQAPTPMSTLIGRGTFFDDLKVRRHDPSEWRVQVDAKGGLDVATQTIVFPAGSQSGWHVHPGPVFIVVQEGTMTFYEADCSTTVVQAGHGFLDTGVEPHIARNESGAPALNVVTYLVPPGTAALRTNVDPPPDCGF